VDGALASYGPNRLDSFTRAATYVDRIFKGAKNQPNYQYKIQLSMTSLSI